MESHLLQMRGLKHEPASPKHHSWSRIFYRCVDWNKLKSWYIFIALCRIFYRCVDWNDFEYLEKPQTVESHLLQMRGLKPHHRSSITPQSSRIFYRCVDWNIFFLQNLSCCPVASFTDAWIETRYNPVLKAWCCVASFTDAWIETILYSTYRIKFYVASFTDAWIETNPIFFFLLPEQSRIFYRCVDWNF